MRMRQRGSLKKISGDKIIYFISYKSYKREVKCGKYVTNEC